MRSTSSDSMWTSDVDTADKTDRLDPQGSHPILLTPTTPLTFVAIISCETFAFRLKELSSGALLGL
eukprot:4226877-Amphidinium_carterae.2